MFLEKDDSTVLESLLSPIVTSNLWATVPTAGWRHSEIGL